MRFLLKAAVALAAVALLVLGFRHAGPALVINRPQRSDVLLVLAGDLNEKRYWAAVAMLRAGYAGQVLVDARADATAYGVTSAELADSFIHRSVPELAGRVSVCPTRGDSTRLELRSAAACLDRAGAHSAVLVTSDFHTRRALSIARHDLPRYTWTAAAADEGLLSRRKWWRDRGLAKDVFLEWQKLAWWQLVDRHRRE